MRIADRTQVRWTNSLTGATGLATVVDANVDLDGKVWWYQILKEDGTKHDALPSILEEIESK